ncbi:MAG TPA: glycosyltransferase [Gammaproteobacteria bacterium]
MFSRSFWQRYLGVFDSVRVIARVRQIDADEPDEGWRRADGAGVEMIGLPDVAGLGQHLAKLLQMKRAVEGVIRPGDAVLGRAPSQETTLVLEHLPTAGYPFGLEVVADPYDVFSRGAVRHPVRPLLRWWSTRTLKRQCFEACAAAYVTEAALQRRYPTSPFAYRASYSSVELDDDAFVDAPRVITAAPAEAKLLAVGSLQQMYKGFDVLIDVAADLLRTNRPVRLRIVGEGRHRIDLERQAAERGIADRVDFVGELPTGEPMRAEYDRANLLVFPSRSEGLPRVLIEGMARGVPCVASRIGGIPELLEDFSLVPPGDAQALAAKLREVLADPVRLSAMSARNLAEARRYHASELQPRREDFYRRLQELTREWVRKRMRRHRRASQ